MDFEKIVWFFSYISYNFRSKVLMHKTSLARENSWHDFTFLIFWFIEFTFSLCSLNLLKSLPVEWSCQGSWIGYGPYYGTATFGQPQNFEPGDINSISKIFILLVIIRDPRTGPDADQRITRSPVMITEYWSILKFRSTVVRPYNYILYSNCYEKICFTCIG